MPYGITAAGNVEDPVQVLHGDATAGVVDLEPGVPVTGTAAITAVPVGGVCRITLDSRLRTTRTSSGSRVTADNIPHHHVIIDNEN